MKKDWSFELESVGAVLRNGHFVYTSGRHGREYVNKDAVYPHTGLTSNLCLALAESFKHAAVEVVVAPALGGIILSQWVAHHLGGLTGKEVLAVYAEKVDGGLALRRGYGAIVKGKRVLLVEDVLTTGGSIKKLIDVIKPLTASIAGIAALCNRGGLKVGDFAPAAEFFALVDLPLETWAASECPLCRGGVAVDTRVGKGGG